MITHLLIVMLVLNLMGLLFFFLPHLAESIPGMNLVYSSYGHNHLGALLIMFIPMIWFLMVKAWLKKNKLQLVVFTLLLVLFFVNLFISFGRLVILIGYLEFILLGLVSYKNFLSKRKLFKLIYFVSVGFFLILVTLTLFISLLTILKVDLQCKNFVPLVYQEKLCKDLTKEARPSYWQVSLRAIKENWLVGYGPGTYGLINTRYKISPEIGSSHAHNAYLQIFAEGGILVFVFFFSLMSLLWVESKKRVNFSFNGIKKFISNFRFDFNQALFIGVSAIYLDVLFDFDWDFLGIFVITLLFILMLIRDSKKHSKEKFYIKKDKFFQIIVKLVFLIIIFLILILEFLNWSVERYISLGNPNKAFEIFPYFQIHMKLFALDKSLIKENNDQLDDIYRNSPSYFLLDEENLDLIKYQDHLTAIDPWFFYSDNLLNKLYELDPNSAEQKLIKLSEIYSKAKENGPIGHTSVNNSLSKLSSKVGDRYFLKKDFIKAAYFYHISLEFYEWIWSDIQPVFSNASLSNSEHQQFWSLMEDFDPDLLSEYQSPIAYSYFPIVKTALIEENWDDFFLGLDRIGQIEDWIKGEFIYQNKIILQEKADSLIEQGEFEMVLRLLKLFKESDHLYWAKSQLGNFYLLQGQIDLAKQAYIECNDNWMNDYAERHDICYFGNRKIEEGLVNKYRYYEVSQIIHGKANSEDFTNLSF